ncbi:hypothetical protein GQR58_019193 [Nymphon striatum]|nr:hypothetical protein GQR58_019193 [Nymphon striatum]
MKTQKEFLKLRSHLEQVIIGQNDLLDRLMISLLTGGHILLESLPGLAKTTAVNTLASGVHASFQRIQFTPDLMPGDLTGTDIYEPQNGSFRFIPGPIFNEIVLADEINRAPPKVQSALLEAMQEHQVTAGGETRKLPELFIVMATQNPLEQSGTYPLPEAQLDRFLLHVVLDYPDPDDELLILQQDRKKKEDDPNPSTNPEIHSPLHPDQVLQARREVSEIHVSLELEKYIVELTGATRHLEQFDDSWKDFLQAGASPRASIGLIRASSALAYLRGRDYVVPDDIIDIAPDVMRASSMKLIDRPLLDEAELQNLYQRAHAPSTVSHQRLLEQHQSGDVASRYRGSGMDYEESRLYQAGDEPRFINWRATARTGQAQIKQFREERRPGVFILVDHRHTMRFGTRVRLKAAQTSRLAALISFASAQQGWTVSGARLNDDIHWFPVSSDLQSIWQFVRECAGPCLPLNSNNGIANHEPCLADVLPQILNQLVRGAHVYLISDFADINEGCMSHLLQLVDKHPVFALHVLDPIELSLPDAGKLVLQGMLSGLDGGELEQDVDLSDPKLREEYQQNADKRQQGIAQQLQESGCDYFRLLSNMEDLETQIPLPHGLGSCWFKRRNPVFRAVRQLRHLSDENPDPNNLANILRDGLQVQSLSDAQLPDEFLKRLNKACFSSEPCNPEEYAALKSEQKKQQWLLLGWLWVMLSITLAQPVRLGEKLPDLPPERDIVLLVDISISMTLKDYEYQGVKISRLDVLKNLLHKFVGRLEGERLAMIVFAETPHLLIPLTRDQTLIQNQLVRLKSSMAGRISALGDAIILGLKEASKQPQRKQIFVVFTDVDESIGRVTPKAAAQLASQSGIPLYNIAIGSTVKSSDISGENTNKKAHNEGLLYQTVNLDLLKSLSVITSGNSYEVGDALAIENALRDIQRQQKNEAEQEPRYAQEIQSYADKALLPWVESNRKQLQRYIRSALWAVFWFLTAVALAGPRLPLEESESNILPNKEIMLVVDLSRSMQTEDIVPSRLERAGLELYEFLQLHSLQKKGASRIGTIVYAARPHVLVPATTDSNALKFYLEKLDSLVLPTLGSNPVAALELAEKQLLSRTDQSLPGMIVWITDGDISDLQEERLKHQVGKLNDAGLSLYILGIGTEDGEAIPLVRSANSASENGKKKWLEENGQVVRSRLNSSLLEQLAEQGNGKYSSVRDDESDWQTLYTNAIAKKGKALNSSEQEQQWEEFYTWPLILAVFLLFMLVALTGTSSKTRPKQIPRTASKNESKSLKSVTILLLSPMILLVIFYIPKPAYAESIYLENKPSSKTSLKEGIKAYRSEKYKKAEKQFISTVYNAKNDEERARALHNLGNSYFQQGDYVAAIQVFQDSLTYRPKNKATLQNLELGKTVQRILENRLLQQITDEALYEGNRLERLSNQLDWDQDSTKTWGESTNKKTNSGLPKLPLNDDQLKILVSKGLQRLEQDGGIGNNKNIKERYQRQQSLIEAQIALQQIEDNPTQFWKRLFEIEEGFPGSLEKPKEVPGVSPW